MCAYTKGKTFEAIKSIGGGGGGEMIVGPSIGK